jgi:hypothetical protein
MKSKEECLRKPSHNPPISQEKAGFGTYSFLKERSFPCSRELNITNGMVSLPLLTVAGPKNSKTSFYYFGPIIVYCADTFVIARTASFSAAARHPQEREKKSVL